MSAEEQKYKALTKDYQKLQNDLQTTIEARQKLESQHQENKNVQSEFAGLAEDANIFKMVGPVLLKQERTEAVLAVDGRLEFIEKEIKRIETQIQEYQDKSDAKRMEIMQLQSQMQPQASS